MRKREGKQSLLRMTSGVKNALSIAVKRDSRSMASLIEKLTKDLLTKEGISWEEDSEENGREIALET